MTDLPDDNPKTAFGVAKPGFHAIPPVALIQLGAAMEEGRRKYGLTNWRDRKVSTSTYYNAALRHLFAYWDGETIDPVSLVTNLGHVMACCAIILDAAAQDMLIDDRPSIPGMTSQTIHALTKALAK
jgi:hypothetical protein